mgnify:CR=1 FL=1
MRKLLALRSPLSVLVWMAWSGIVMNCPAADVASQPTTMQAASTQPDMARAREKIDRFIESLASDPAVDQNAKNVLVDAWKRRRPEADPRGFLEEAMAVVSSEYRKALDAMGASQFAQAEAILQPLCESKNPYVAVHAASQLLLSLVQQDKLDAAMKLSEAWQVRADLVEQHSFQAAEMAYLRAYAYLGNLRYDRAAVAYERFLKDYPDASDRLRLTAKQILQELMQRKPNGLSDVADLMNYAGRQLRLGLSDLPVTEAQDKALSLLGSLIQEAEQQEQQQSDSSKSSGGGKTPSDQKPMTPAQRSELSGGQSQEGELHRSPVARPGDMWGKMPPRDREKILQSLRKSFPSRYRELVEQYYRQAGKRE